MIISFDFLDFGLEINRLSAYQIVEDYLIRNNRHILGYFEQVKDLIVSDFNDFESTLIEKLGELLQERDFITDLDFPDLANEAFIQQVQQVFRTLEAGQSMTREKRFLYLEA